MKFTLALFAGAAMASAFGTPVEKNADLARRDGPTVNSAIAAIQAGTESLGSAVNAFNGVGDVAALEAASSSLISTIQAQTELVGASSELTTAEAIPLAGTITSLSDAVTAAVDATIAKKETFASAGVGSVVLAQLTQLRDLSATFSQTTISKVPAGLQDLANSLAQPISDALNRAVTAFADQTGSGSTTSASASASVSATATTSTAVVSSTTTGAPGTTPAPTTTTRTATPTASNPIATFTGAAVTNAAGLGAVAMVAFAAVAAL